jgi:multisubunit Na+/H+ antiporter MnhF subunit
MNRLIALELASVAATVVTLLFALDINTGSFVDLAVVFGVVSLPSALVFLRFLERWI